MTIDVPGVPEEEVQAWVDKVMATARPLSATAHARIRALFAPYVAKEEAERASARD